MSADDAAARVLSGVRMMEALAAEIAQQLRAGDALLLYGELGAGKTTFVQSLARAWGVTEAVTSPTFTIVSEYVLPHASIPRLMHADLYRLTAASAAADPALRDIVDPTQRQDAVLVVEWADRLTWPEQARVFSLHFTHGKTPDERHVALDPALLSASS